MRSTKQSNETDRGVTRRLRSKFTYANVMVTILAFVGLGSGAAYAASVIVSSNAQIAANTVAGHHPPSGAHANLIPGSVNASDLANGAVTPAKAGNVRRIQWNPSVSSDALGTVLNFGGFVLKAGCNPNAANLASVAFLDVTSTIGTTNTGFTTDGSYIVNNSHAGFAGSGIAIEVGAISTASEQAYASADGVIVFDNAATHTVVTVTVHVLATYSANTGARCEFDGTATMA